ncbi:MAG: tRNA (adenosine(37)-N6)-dimethylallyltransferase MiaA, partial [Candidatus Peribacteraceae bacterium]|nr:tRNA (adenosine(37)-N6)-dimethylallyltransferase MiaA [Candidatus Peribacteraceae bacterium]
VMSTLHADSASLISTHLKNSKRPLLVVLGPTASGKTSFSIQLAKHIGNVEIVNADSRQFYKYLNIGTAKITEEEKQGITHHLIDILDPNEESTAGWYQIEATKVVEDIIDRGKIPILVGGSMLYISSIIDGLSMAPSTTPEIRDRFIKEYEKDNGKSLYEKLCRVDPKTAEKIHQNNMPRLIRALEIHELTKTPKSSAVPNSELRTGNNKKFDTLIFGMKKERNDLVEIINIRTDSMLNSGWIKEVEKLIEMGYTEKDPGMKSCGYREIYSFLKNGMNIPMKELSEKISAKSRQYAKRQMTWWRGDDRINWLSLNDS